jgi:Putative zinc-finger
MKEEPMDCAAPERELIPFLASRKLSAEEAVRAEAHLEGCAACQAERAEASALLEGLALTHLTPDEIVEAAWEGGTSAHLDDCARCREEVTTIRASAADLQRLAARPAPLWQRPQLAWAAALLLAIPAGLYVAGALRTGATDGPVFRGSAPASRVSVPQPLVLSPGAATSLPRAEVLLDFARAGVGPGHRHEARLVDGRGVTLWEGTLSESADGRAYLILDARDLPSGRLTLEVRRHDPAGLEQGRTVYELTAPR